MITLDYVIYREKKCKNKGQKNKFKLKFRHIKYFFNSRVEALIQNYIETKGVYTKGETLGQCYSSFRVPICPVS